jgi:hypothetical protein
MVPFIWQNVGVLWECCGVWPIELLSTWVRSGTPKETCHCACCIRRRQKRPHENHSIPPRIPTSLGPHEVLGYRNFVKLPLFTQPWTRSPLYPTPSHNCFGQKRLYKESHFSHVFGHHSNAVVFGCPLSCCFSVPLQRQNGGVCLPHLTWAGATTYYLQDHSAKFTWPFCKSTLKTIP